MDFLKKHIEKLVFVLLLLALVLSVSEFVVQRSTYEPVDRMSLVEPEDDFTRDIDPLTQLYESITTNPKAVDVAMGSFTPEPRVPCMNPDDRTLIPVDAEICPYCGYEQTERQRFSTGYEIPDEYLLDLGLDPTDPSVVHLDLDGDGFSVLEEFLAGTDPTDATSHPALVDYLRLESVEETSIRFELRGTATFGGSMTLQLNWRYPDESRGTTEYIRVGNRFGREDEFLAESFDENFRIDGARRIDESRAVIRSGRHELRLGRDGDDRFGSITERAADIILVKGPDWSKTIREDETFELDNKSYKVVDISRNSVRLQAQETSEEITIGEPTSEELQQLEPDESDDAMNDQEFFDSIIF